MRILKKLLLGLIFLVVILAVVGLLLPSKVHVERATTINAPAETIHALISDFHNFNQWSPWAQIDPNTRYTFEGPASGVGAKMKWNSDNSKVGSGSQEITADDPNLVKVALDFGPHGTAIASFKLEPEGSGTKVTWGFDTDFGYNLMGRYFGLMMERWIGADYEKGLAALKSLAEKKAAGG
jgi:carbon monoxide dehydrogenase subunit G